MHKLTKQTAIPKRVKMIVGERDNWSCIICGRRGDPVAHVVSRAQMGKGIPENIVTLCYECHRKYDGTERKVYGKMIRDYLKEVYTEWNEEDMKVK